MKKTVRRTINVILILVLTAATVLFIKSRYESAVSRQQYEQALEIATGVSGETSAQEEQPAESGKQEEESSEVPEEKEEIKAEIPDDPFIKELFAIDLEALREENEDVIGWIVIPDTKLNYPLLQWTDNEFYLNHTWNQKFNPSGAIFMDYQNKADFSEFNTIIYGHNMMEGFMFGSLHNYRSGSYAQQHPYVYIVNDEGVLRYDVFSAQFANTDSVFYGLGIESDGKKEEFLRFAQDYSSFESDVKPGVEDKIVTLSTCSGGSYEKRWVVLGVLNEENSYKRPE